MTRKPHITTTERRTLRLAAWGGGWGAQGYCDGYDVLPPCPPAEREAAQLYTVGYGLGVEWRQSQRAAEGETP